MRVRALVYVGDNATRLVSRTGKDRTASYPELARLHDRITAVNAVVDGEIVAQDPNGRPSFGLLQRRMHVYEGPLNILRGGSGFVGPARQGEGGGFHPI